MVIPLNNFEGNSPAEKLVWKQFEKFLPNEYISFHNYYLGVKQADVILLCPNRGILIIEIKGFYSKNIIDVPDNTIIRMKNRPGEPSPWNQAIKYRNILINDFLYPNNIDSVYVTTAVCYPYIKDDEYRAKGLNKISAPDFTITEEDLLNSTTILAKIQRIFDLTYNAIAIPTLVKYGFDVVLAEKVGNIISPNFREIDTTVLVDDDVELVSKRQFYSKLIFKNDRDIMSTEDIDQLILNWTSGTKIYFYSANETLINTVKEQFENTIKERNLSERDDFEFKNSLAFLVDVCFVDCQMDSFEIIDGEDSCLYEQQLNIIHYSQGCSFNKDQYELEHYKLDDIIVKAGAGTGKTFSIVSRINYIVWKNNYDPSELKKAIVMITFTNESADKMKEKLSNNFLNYYLLTKNIKFLDFVEFAEDMSISTIHSLCKKIISKYSSLVGLGKDFTIVTGNYKRRQILNNHLNSFIKSNPGLVESTQMSMFYLQERLLLLLDKLDNKNVDIVNDKSILNFGTISNNAIEKLIEHVIYDTQKEMDEFYDKNNSVSLGGLMRKLKVIQKSIKSSKLIIKEKIDFLFVDEFQDTDDVQIELMKSFREIFNFKFFVVGDIKQCIYRFRGAEEKAFTTLTDKGTVKMKEISLNKNYRTDKNLMNELNQIFTVWNKNENLDYSKDDILIGTKNYCETSELYQVVCNNEKEYEDQLIDKVKFLRDGLQSHEDKVAILVRYNWQISLIKDLCTQYNINIETNIGGELFKIDPTIDFFKVILALKYNKSAEHLYNLYTTSYVKDDMPKGYLWNLKSQEIVEYFENHLPQGLHKWFDYLNRIRVEPVIKILREIVNDLKPWETFAQKVNYVTKEDFERNESYYIRNLDQLFEKLIIASNTDYLTLNKLSEYLEIMILTRRDEEARASYDIENSTSNIICTTVHKSKGLEFNSVLLPFCNFDISCGKALGDVDLIYANNDIGYRIIGKDYKISFENNLYKIYKENEMIDRKHEETRILYVALTRAIKQIVFFTDNYSKRHKSSWNELILEGRK